MTPPRMGAWNIKTRIIAGFSVVILIIGLLAIFSFHGLQSIRRQAIAITGDSLPGVLYMTGIESQARSNYAIAMRRAGASAADNKRYGDQIQANNERIAELLKAYEPTVLEETDRALVDSIKSQLPPVAAAERALSRTNPQNAVEATALRRDLDAAEDKLIGAIKADVDYNNHSLQKDANDVVKEVQNSTRLLVAALLFGFLCAGLTTWVLLRKIMEDIADRALADRELRQSEEQLRTIIRAASDAVWDWNVKTGEVHLSDRGYSMLGLTPQSIQPTFESFRALIHPEDVGRFQQAIAEHLEHGKPFQVRLRVHQNDGSFVPVLVRGQLQREAGRMVGVFTDLSIVEGAEEQIRQQAELLDQAHDAIAVRDLDERITFWSKGAERLYGWPASDAMGRRFDELLAIKSPGFEAARKSALADGIWSGEVEKATAAGQIVTVDSSWTLLRDDQSRPTAIFSIDTNITDRKSLEKQFLRAQRLESLGTLAGGIAHDLNNMLMPILMGVTLLRRLEPGERSLHAINNIEQSVKRGTDLVKQVLLFARGVDSVRTAVDAGKIVSEVRSIAESTFPKNIAFATTMPETLAKVIGDATQLTQVLLNLCVNARDAMPNGGRITISAANREIDHQYAVTHGGASAGRYVLLEVADNGSGISREVLDRIFEPFFTTKEVGKGTGLGLSTVQGIVRSCGGFIEVSSEIGRGSTFRVYLPAYSEAAGPAIIEAGAEQLPHGNGELILVVDDEALVLSITRQTLEEFGYAVLTAEDGAEAISVYVRERANIAAVMTDMMMPVMGGAALIAALRRINPDVPIIAMSGHAEPDEIARVTRTGAVRMLPKPCSAEDLLLTLFRVLGGSSVPGGSRSQGSP